MKHNKKVNPLTHFNNLKAAAIKKAGVEMSKYKKSLPKKNNGGPGDNLSAWGKLAQGPLERIDAKRVDRLYGPNTPMILSPETINDKIDVKTTVENDIRENKRTFNQGKYQEIEEKIKSGELPIDGVYLKKGGSVKRKRK